MSESKIIDSLNRTLSLLGGVDNMINEEDGKELVLKLWKISAEVEYCCFLLSITHDLATFTPELKKAPMTPNSPNEQLTLVRSHVSEALQLYTNDPREAYANLKRVTRILRELLKNYEKS